MEAEGRQREQGGTRGHPNRRMPWLAYALLLLVIALVGATSPWIKQPPGSGQPLWPLVIDELTSVLMVFVLTPGIIWIVHAQGPKRVGWAQALAVQSLGLLAFTATHIAGMLVLRKTIYPLFGSAYSGEKDWLFGVILYEGRKDVLSYAALAGIITLLMRLQTPALPASAAAKRNGTHSLVRIPHRDGALNLWVGSEEILWVEAAGNYVELVLASRRLLQRQSLNAIHDMLSGAGFVRAHRSRIVNPAHIRSLTGKSNGDFTMTFSDGREITGSRRFRHAVMSALAT
jgi:hypothetical protein